MSTTLKSSIGERIREIRKNKGFSQEEIAQVLGLHRPSISQIEHGDRDVTAQELVQLSELFNVSMEEITSPKGGAVQKGGPIMSDLTITFFRHGEAVDDIYDQYGGWANPDLTPRGINQAYTKARELAAENVTFDIIYTSPLKRAKQVAEIFGNALRVDVKILQYLKEWNKYGLLSGINKRVAKKKFPELVGAYDAGRYVLGSERKGDLENRIPLVFQYIKRRDYKDVCCITHGNVLKTIIRESLRMKPDHIEDVAMLKVAADSKQVHLIKSEGISFTK